MNLLKLGRNGENKNFMKKQGYKTDMIGGSVSNSVLLDIS
jgi:hypothetical protein